VYVQESVERLLARQTPVAADLRLVLGMLHVNLHLERATDYCVTIAKLVKLAHALERDAVLVEALEAMGARAEEMLRMAVASFREREASRAESLVGLDEEIDIANRQLVHDILALGGDEERRQRELRMILVSRCLERSGTTPSTSASRPPTWSRASFASSPTRPIRLAAPVKSPTARTGERRI
jgi:phosphate transport system protein